MERGLHTRRTEVEKVAPRSLSEASTLPRGHVQPSPESWLDATLYFLMVDRFSDGLEDDPSNPRPMYTPRDFGVSSPSWLERGKTFVGGTIRGITSKLKYLKDLGITAIWITPIMKQRADLQTYHGYGIQNFLEVQTHRIDRTIP